MSVRTFPSRSTTPDSLSWILLVRPEVVITVTPLRVNVPLAPTLRITLAPLASTYFPLEGSWYSSDEIVPYCHSP